MYTNKIRIFTDGACSGNPGPGGWAAAFLLKDKCSVISGFELHTTNNRMELKSVIQAIKKTVKLGYSNIEIYSDSAYVVNSINSKHLERWHKTEWKTKKGEEIKNKDLWNELNTLILNTNQNISFVKVKGHDGNTFNEMVDKKAVEMVDKAKEILKNGND